MNNVGSISDNQKSWKKCHIPSGNSWPRQKPQLVTCLLTARYSSRTPVLQFYSYFSPAARGKRRYGEGTRFIVKVNEKTKLQTSHFECVASIISLIKQRLILDLTRNSPQMSKLTNPHIPWHAWSPDKNVPRNLPKRITIPDYLVLEILDLWRCRGQEPVK